VPVHRSSRKSLAVSRITRRFRFPVATNSLRFDSAVQGKETLGIDLPSLFAGFRSLVSTDPRVPGAQAILRRLPTGDGRPSIRSAMASRGSRQFVIEAREPRLRCAATQARKSGAVLPQCNFSYEKEPQLRLPLSELSAPCEVLLARQVRIQRGTTPRRLARHRNCWLIAHGGSNCVPLPRCSPSRSALVANSEPQSNRRKERPLHV